MTRGQNGSVTSFSVGLFHPQHLAGLDRRTTIELPTRVWAAVAREELDVPDSEPPSCVPLVLAPRWAAANPWGGAPRPGPETLRRVYDRFSRDRSGRGEPG